MTVSQDCSLDDGSVDVVKSDEDEAWPGSLTNRCRFSSEDPEPPDPPENQNEIILRHSSFINSLRSFIQSSA